MAEATERVFDLHRPDPSVYEKMEALIREKLREAYRITEKGKRRERLEEILEFAVKECGAEDETSQKKVKGRL